MSIFFGVFELVTVTVTFGLIVCFGIYPLYKLPFSLLWFIDIYTDLSFVIILDMVEFIDVNFELADLKALSFSELVLDRRLVLESNDEWVDMVLVEP